MPHPVVKSSTAHSSPVTQATTTRNVFTEEEINLLGNIIGNESEDRLPIILSKGNSIDARAQRSSVWNKIAVEFNDQAAELSFGYSGHKRTGDQLKRKFQAIRTQAKSDAAAAKNSLTTTGGGRLGVSNSRSNFTINLSQEEIHGVGNDVFGTVRLPSVQKSGTESAPDIHSPPADPPTNNGDSTEVCDIDCEKEQPAVELCRLVTIR